MSAASLTDRAAARQQFRRQLLTWYDRQKRDLPWRASRDPYRVWVSEIMLQQTRVGAIRERYGQFLDKFPTVERLAAVRVSSVVAAWSGLGYYRRARFMHQAARTIVTEHGGRFPHTATQLQTLPGVGRYTAAAIASIAFDEPAAVVDGNVLRVLRRLVGRALPEGETWEQAQALMSRSRPGDFNQAMMELGATVCLARGPRCASCPVHGMCATQGEHARPRGGQRRRQTIFYALASRAGAVRLVRRPDKASLMPAMWELPQIETNGHRPWLTLKHSITVTDYSVHVLRGAGPVPEGGQWIAVSRLKRLPLTGLARKILSAAKII